MFQPIRLGLSIVTLIFFSVTSSAVYAAAKEALEQDIRETEAFIFGDRYGA